MTNERVVKLAKELNGVVTEEGMVLMSKLILDDVDMVKVEIQDREEFPIYVTVDEDQILCTSPLWTESEIRTEKRTELLEAMLTMSVPMPLSAFGKVGDQYLLFGAVAIDSDVDQVCQEVCVLSHNTLSTVESVSDFLQ